MSWLRFFRRDAWDAERAREIDSYLEIETGENMARGMSPRDALAAAHRKFGNPRIVREEIYRMNTVSWFNNLAQDLRHGARLLRLNPAFSLVAILSLALGIGANTAIFQLLDAVRLRTLPVRNPSELVAIKIVGGNHGMGVNDDYGELTHPMWQEIRRAHPGFSSVLAWGKQNMSVGSGSTFKPVDGIVVSGEFFRVLGIDPWRGRLIFPEDEHACPETTAVVSHSFWRNSMGERPIDAKTTLFINGSWMQVVGVVPPSFSGVAVGERFDVALPICQPKELSRNWFAVTVMGRLGPGETISHASSQLAALSPGIMAATEITGYDANTTAAYRHFRLAAYPAASGVSNLRNAYDSSLWLLLAISGLVLLIACANLANLMLARGAVREREFAVRLALGAARFRLVRQLLAESILLAALGAAMGIALAEILSRVLVASLSTSESAVNLPTGIDWRVLLFAAGVAVLTCIVFGLAPAFRASTVDPADALKSGTRNIAGQHFGRFSLQRVMVVTQISVSLVLLFGALLFVRSFVNLITSQSGMRQDGITVAFLGFQQSNIRREGFDDFRQRLLDEIRLEPGILHAASTTMVPLLGGSWGHAITIGQVEGPAKFTWVSPGYFETMGVPVLTGRDFNERDTGSAQRVAIVNQAFVRTYLPNSNPIGKTMRTHPEPEYPATVYEIAGVIPDTRYNDLRGATPPMVFAPASQLPTPRPWTAIMIHSNLPPARAVEAVKRRIATNHPEVIVQGGSFEKRILDGLIQERLMAVLSGLFGLLAVLLATAGLYGVVSYLVTRRRNEIGIRVALGASRYQVVGLVMREASGLLAVGLVLGAALSLTAGRLARSLLFDIKPNDPTTLACAALLLFAIGAWASFLPARRASTVDPMVALRCD